VIEIVPLPPAAAMLLLAGLIEYVHGAGVPGAVNWSGVEYALVPPLL
jgi:hypothetical protein